MRFGPHASTRSASGAAATAVPAKPEVPSSVAMITSSPSDSAHSSSAVRAPCTHVTCRPAARASRAASGIGATPRPPLMSTAALPPPERSKPWPSGPRQLTVSPLRIASSWAVPTPTALRITSIASPSARYTENGRRSRTPGTPRFTNCPALTSAATSGARIEITHMSRATWREPVMGASVSSKARRLPPLLDGAHLEIRRLRGGRLEERRRGVERGEARDPPLHGRAPDLEAVLDDRPAVFARIRVDVRHGVDDEVDLTAGDDVEHRRPFLPDLRDHARREACLAQRPRGAFGRDELAAHLHQARDDLEHLALVGVGDGQRH